MVMPGKSGRRRSRTSPMFSRTLPAPAAPIASVMGWRSLRLVALEEHQPVLADLDLVGVLEQDGVDPVAVDVGAVEAAGVGHGERVALTGERRVPTRHRHVVEEDLAVGVTAGGDDVLVEQEPAARAGTSLYDEQCRPDRKGVHRSRVDRVELPVRGDLGPLRTGDGAPDVDGRGRVTGALRRQRRTALRAE